MGSIVKYRKKKYNGVDWDTMYPETSADQVIESATREFCTPTQKVGYEEGHAHSSTPHAPADAEANVQADWNAVSGDAFILNKPVITGGGAPFVTSAGTLPAYTATAAGITLVAGASIKLKIHATNTATANTLDVNALGARGIKFQGQDVAVGMLQINGIIPMVYDGTYWQIESLDSAYQFIPITTGTGAAYLLTVPGYTVFTTGMIIPIKFHLANTIVGATINVNSLGVKTIQRGGVALLVGEIGLNTNGFLVYDGTNFQMFAIGENYATIGGLMFGATNKATPADADYFGFEDSAAAHVLKKVSWGQIKTALLAYFTTVTTTWTNKRIQPRMLQVASSSSLTITADSCDVYQVTALAIAMTINAPTGTPVTWQPLQIRIKDNGVAPRVLTWNAIFRPIGVTLPTTTVLNKTMYIGCRYNVEAVKWDVLAVGQE